MPLIYQPPKDRIILGLMTIGPEGSDGARITDLDTFNKVLDVFQGKGYGEVDTARIYCGTKQAFTREARWKERGLTLATKVRLPKEPGSNMAAKVKESVEESLEALSTSCVDILYLHAADRHTPFQETLEAMDQLHRQGKFVQLGISNFAAFEVTEIVMTCQNRGWVRPTVYQAMYNIITRNIEAELLVACRRYGLDVVVYNPIAGGLFSGKIKPADMKPDSGRFSDTSSLGALYRQRYYRESTFRAMQLIEAAVEKHGLSMIETALRWVVHHSKLRIKKGRDGVIIGTSSVAQLEENLGHLEKGPLLDEVVQALDKAWGVAKVDSSHYWHGELTYGYNTHEALFAPAAR